jgi:transposase
MKTKARKSCPNCSRLQAKLNAQQAELEAQRQRLAAIEATVASLQEQLAAARKNSATSSKPPSSDIVKPPKPSPPEGQAQRQIGGQPGHPKHERDPFPPEAINDGSFDYRIELCPRCGQDLEPAAWSEPRIIQQLDIHDVPLSIQEHRGHSGWCSCCQKLYTAPLPIGIERGRLVGPRLTTLIAYLKGVCHASFSTIRKFLRDVLHVTISRGQLAAIIGKVTGALEQPYQELLDRLPTEDQLNVDETGHKQNRLRMWTWSRSLRGSWAATTFRPIAATWIGST